MGNDFVGDAYKARLRKSAKLGRDGSKTDQKSSGKKSCVTEFPCVQLDNSSLLEAKMKIASK